MLLLCFKNFTLPPTPLKAICCFFQLQSQLDLFSRPKFAPLSRSFHNAPTEHSFSLNTPVFDSFVSHHDPMCTFPSEMSALFFTSAIMHNYAALLRAIPFPSRFDLGFFALSIIPICVFDGRNFGVFHQFISLACFSFNTGGLDTIRSVGHMRG